MTPLQSQMAELQQRIELQLKRRLPPETDLPAQLHQAMRYGSLGGGKRIRATLVYLTGGLFNTPLTALDGPACALELMHAYSLIHDDLPAMDDDHLRRGRPTCHCVYGDAVAILAGDALQPLSFEILASDPTIVAPPQQRLNMIKLLAHATGSLGMVGGQAIDIASSGGVQGIDELAQMHRMKTGALIDAAIQLGAHAGTVLPTPAQLDALKHYGADLGLAFQIQDDILDIEGDTTTLGKPKGSDEAAAKSTYPSLLGIEEARKMAAQLHQHAITALAPFGASAELLKRVADFIIQRNH